METILPLASLLRRQRFLSLATAALHPVTSSSPSTPGRFLSSIAQPTASAPASPPTRSHSRGKPKSREQEATKTAARPCGEPGRAALPRQTHPYGSQPEKSAAPSPATDAAAPAHTRALRGEGKRPSGSAACGEDQRGLLRLPPRSGHGEWGARAEKDGGLPSPSLLPRSLPPSPPLLPRHAADPLQVKRWLSLISPQRKGWRTGTLSAEVSRSASRPRQAPKRKPLHPVNPLGASRRAEKGGSCRRRRHRRGDGDARKGGPAPPPFPAHLSVRGARARLRKGMPGRRLHISTATPSHGQRWGGGVG